MADLNLTAVWESGVYQLETTDPVQGGASGISNLQGIQLGNRTEFLKTQVDGIIKRQGGYNSVRTFTGSALNNTLVSGDAHIVTGINNDLLNNIQQINLNLPSALSAGVGAAILVVGVNAGTQAGVITGLPNLRGFAFINRAGSDLIQLPHTTAGVNSISIINGESVLLISNGSNRWIVAQWQRADVTPAGVVSFFGGINVPEGYLVCNGAAISRTIYAALFEAIGTRYGTGDGSTTFNLPDLRGEFIRGWDNGRGIDSGRLIASAQGQAIQSHTHSITEIGTDSISSGGSITNFRSGAGTTATGVTGSTGGGETRPRNIAMLPIIKF